MTQPVEIPREVMNIPQAAEYLGISADTMYRYAATKFVPAFRLGNLWRFKKSLLDQWMARMSTSHSPKPSGPKLVRNR
jgi:excisionase family DNA binding protein